MPKYKVSSNKLGEKLRASHKKLQAVKDALDKETSTYEEYHEDIKRLLMSEDQDDLAVLLMVKAFLRTTLDIIPTSEKAYRRWKNERSAYAYIALVNLANTLGASVKSLSGSMGSPDRILQDIIEPHLLQQSQYFANNLKLLEQTLAKRFGKSDYDLKFIQEHVKNINQENNKMFTEQKFSIEKSLRNMLN